MWFRACVCVCRPCVRVWILWTRTATKPLHISLSNLADMLTRMREWTLWIFEVRGQKVKVTMDKYGNRLVNMIATIPLCASWSKLADVLTMVRGWTLLIFEIKGQRSRSQWTYMEISLWTWKRLYLCVFLYQTWRTCKPWWEDGPYWFLRSQFKGEGQDGYRWQMWGARGRYALRCYI